MTTLPSPERSEIPEHDAAPSRWKLIRDLLVFQAKLVIDGLRDLALSPISLVAALAGIIVLREDPDRWFRQVILMGRRSERWINLFGRYWRNKEPGLDELFGRVEQRLVEQHARGGMTAQAKGVVDRSLDRVHSQVQNLVDRQSQRDPQD